MPEPKKDNVFDKIKLTDTAIQNKLILDALCNLKGKELDNVFSNISIKDLKELVGAYPEYKNKLPKKLMKLMKPVIIEREMKIPLKIKCTVNIKYDSDYSPKDVVSKVIIPAIKNTKFSVTSALNPNFKIKEVAVIKVISDNKE